MILCVYLFIGTTWQSFGTGYLVPGFHKFTFVATDTVSGAEHINVQPFFVNTSEQYSTCTLSECISIQYM